MNAIVKFNSDVSAMLREDYQRLYPDVSLPVQEALLYSFPLAADYISQHSYGNSPASRQVAGVLGTSRLQWLLERTRDSLSGRFTRDEVIALLDCNQDGVYFPDRFTDLATELCEHLGIELEELEQTRVFALVKKLLALTDVERVALADLLEMTWHIGMKGGSTVEEACAQVGLELA